MKGYECPSCSGITRVDVKIDWCVWCGADVWPKQEFFDLCEYCEAAEAMAGEEYCQQCYAAEFGDYGAGQWCTSCFEQPAMINRSFCTACYAQEAWNEQYDGTGNWDHPYVEPVYLIPPIDEELELIPVTRKS